MRKFIALITIIILYASSNAFSEQALPSWNDSKPKQSIISFVEEVTDPNSKSYVKPEERIAVFDNDGTLWAEQPIYFQLAFVSDRIKELAPANP
ncbi:MAG: haloacid dehalogenase-like hydrolase, partial [Thermodesulfobacteriota bacterium]